MNGYVFIYRISWDNFNEGGDLKAQIEACKNQTGFYPESVQVDKIYRTRENRAYCQERGIRISGPPLGRPKINISIEEKKLSRKDEGIRNTIEGKFGQGKRRFSLGRVMTKLPNTSQTSIAITFLVINLDRLLRQVLGLFFVNFKLRTIFLLFWQTRINKSYTSPSYENKNLSC